MNQNSYIHSPYYSPPQVNVGQGYVPLPQTGVMVSTQTPIGMPQVRIPATWQGWQPPAFIDSAIPQGMPLAQQWASPGQYQVFEQRDARGASTNPFAASPAHSLLRQSVHLGQHDNLAPVHLSPENERVLIEALKAGLTEGLTPRQIVERLQATNNGAGIGWKDMFLDHMERLYPQVFSTDSRSYEPLPYSSASQTQSSSSFTGSPDRSYRLQERHNTQRGRNVGSSRPTSGRRNRNRDRTGRYTHKAAAPMSAASTSSSQLSSHRPKRRGSLLDYHDNTLIPPSTTSHKPKAPNDTHRGSFRFTDDDKVFFIHFLRWRLRDGDVPERGVLYEELAEETPHHDAESWRKHWDSAPSLPDRIYIEARKRAVVANGAITTANSSEGESDIGADWGLEDEALPSTQVSSRLATTRLHQRITDEDLHKMAEFLVEKRHSLHYQSQSELWREFYGRPENKQRRTYNGWRGAARYYESKIQQYVDEITVGLTESNTDNEESEVYHETQPAEDDTRSQPSASTTSALHGNVRQASSPGISLKRSISEGESVVEKDEKPAKVECIDLTD